MQIAPDKILIIRNDKIGDFCLALPTFALLKHCLPETKIHALVPRYTHPIAKNCPYIDEVIIDAGKQANKIESAQLCSSIRASNYSVSLTLYSTTRIGILLRRCKIPIRIAPATKLAQIFHNHRITQRRSQSLKPEFEYNLELAKTLLNLTKTNCDFSPCSPYLSFDASETSQLRQAFIAKHQIDREYLIFIHPGSGGSANNLNIQQFSSLAKLLAADKRYHIVISAGPDEVEIARQCSTILNNSGLQSSHCVYESNEGLTQFIKHIAIADFFVSGSTGPLHIAGALNRPTAGFYPNRQSATSLRWQTLSHDDRRLAFSPPVGRGKDDMSKLDLQQAAVDIHKMLAQLYK